jgi:folylpolyglutamate synthase/dihydropteroate synthase
LKIKEISEKISVSPTYYEAIVCAGIFAAKDAGCKFLIGEIGIGGRLDAVNAIRGKRIAAVTFIGDDHLERFEGKLEVLAREKAGIFTKDAVIMLSYEQKFRSIFEKISGRKILFLKGVWKNLNKKLARNICEIALGTNAFVMTNLKLPCRWEIIPSPPPPLPGGEGSKIILDGAHSAPRFENILPKLKKIQGKKVGVLGLGKNHNPEIFGIIADEFDEIFWVKIPESRDAWDPQILKEKMGRGIVCADAKSAIEQALGERGTILVNGFFLGGEVRNLFYDPQKVLEQQTEFPV